MLKLKNDERIELASDIEKILDYMSLLNELELDDIAGMVSPVEKNMSPRTDKDLVFEGITGIVEQFPEHEERYLKVPSIYGNE